MLSNHRCVICDARLDVHRAARGRLCASPSCLRKKLQLDEAQKRAAERARAEAAVQAWLGAAPRALRASATAAAVVLVPANPHRVTALPAKRRRAFVAHLREVIAEALGGKAKTRPRRPADDPGAIAPGHPVLSAACATCRGRCCAQGGTHAFIDVDTIRRFVSEHGVRNPRAIARAYLRHLPERSYADSCVFQGRTGCSLPRDVRAGICNWFYCGPLKTRWTTLTTVGEQPIAIAAADDGAPQRVALVDATGRIRPLPRPRGDLQSRRR